MYGQEKINPYEQSGQKTAQVEQMFDAVAHSYDTLNHRLSFCIDKYWRNHVVRKLQAVRSADSVLDVATGTGDLAILEARKLKPGKVVGIDISEGMMQVGREKVKAAALQDVISFQREDCLSMTFPDASFDVVTAAFGIRNFQDLEAGLREMYRVLKPGGTLCVIELTRPVHFPREAALHAILTHATPPLRAHDIKGQERIQVSHSHHRSLSARRGDGGNTEENRIQHRRFQTSYVWNLHMLYSNKIIMTYGQVWTNRLSSRAFILQELLQREIPE